MRLSKYLLIGMICGTLAALIVLNIPNIIDYYINHEVAGKPIDCHKTNCVIQGKYNDSSIDMLWGSLPLDRRLNTEWLYKECKHSIGDEVKYFGQRYQGKFIIRRELC